MAPRCATGWACVSVSEPGASITGRREVCDNFRGADLTASTWRPVVARRCKVPTDLARPLSALFGFSRCSLRVDPVF
jgi:hypothetical protein